MLPQELTPLAEQFLLDAHIVLPGHTVIERKVIATCNHVHTEIFEAIYQKLTPELREDISALLNTNETQQRSYLSALKEYPPSARIKSIRTYLDRYKKLNDLNLSVFDSNFIDPLFLDYLYKLTKRYNARDIKRFDKYKRYALMICFLIESRKIILDHLVNMHDQYMMGLCRKCRNAHQEKHRKFRKKHKKAVDVILQTTDTLLELPEKESFTREDIFNQIDEEVLRQSIEDMRTFKHIEERGYSDLLLARYPSFRKYFPDFIKLPFQAQKGSQYLIEAIEIIRKLDAGDIKALPADPPTQFVPHELRAALEGKDGSFNRNIWEIGLALSMRDKLRSGDLYLPQSKQHVSFWDLMVTELRWQDIKSESFTELGMPQKHEAKSFLHVQYETAIQKAAKRWNLDDFATIVNGKLKLKRDDKLIHPQSVIDLQKTIEANLPTIRIEKLLMEVDRLTGFTQHFKPIQDHQARPENFYKTLIATIISQATNLGIVVTSASVHGVSVDMLRQILCAYIREETLIAASAEIVNHHHRHPLSASHGPGDISSSDAQRFKVRADSLLASCYPRYYGYYEKAIGIYTHVSNQLSVFSTQVILMHPLVFSLNYQDEY